MSVDYYLPPGDTDRGNFISNFADKLPQHAAVLGIDAATVTFVTDAAIYVRFVLDTNERLKKQTNEWVSYKEVLIHGKQGDVVGGVPTLITITPPAVVITEPIFARVAKLVNTIKNNPNYTDSIGRDLGIIGAEISPPDPNTAQPVISLVLTASHVIIKWAKGQFDSIDIYRDRSKGNGFEYVANASQSNFEIPIGLPVGATPENWTFKAIFRLGNKQVGLFSKPVSILVSSVY